ILTENTFPERNNVQAQAINYAYYPSAYQAGGDQMAAYTILGGDGMRYEYAQPVYNIRQKEVMFSHAQQNATFHTTSYLPSEASINNDKGREHLYSANEIPAYAYSHLLTAVFSADYVDLKGDGPTADDLGYYAKFNYVKTSSNYKWRSPFKDANYAPGYNSDPWDDKATYVFGEKEVYYLNSVETKTHIAEFYTSVRNDGYGASDEHTGGIGATQRKLDRIELYAKADRNQALKKVHFEYDYSLCKGIPNQSTPNSTASGKLTLKRLYFTYRGNNKGKLTPYIFDYRETDPNYNPNYNILQMDRWGYYKPDRAVNASLELNEDNPYVNQTNKADQDKYVAAWNLHAITLPSGGKMFVDYESDDYGYVQDKEAMQMFKIVKTGTADYNANGENRLYSNQAGASGEKIFNRVYFDLEKPISSAAELQQYIQGVDQLYFKTYINLKKAQAAAGNWVDGHDYVEGFCEVASIAFDTDPATVQNGNYTRAYLVLKPATVYQNSVDGGLTHPFSKAAWEYMKVRRPDLLFQSVPINPDESVLQNIATQLSSIGYSYFRNMAQLVMGYYVSCRAQGFAKAYTIDQYHPSFIRLNSSDGIKLGGGHRVKAVRMTDNWNALTQKDITNTQSFAQAEASFADYGVEYDYTLLDGRSSGVASYEPLIGGEENALRLPTDRFSNGRKFLFSSKDLYLIEPIGESYYPDAQVGYSRVTVRNRKQVQNNVEVNKTTAPGVTVMEFYTAKDFPVRVEHTSIDDCHYTPSITIPFVGHWDYNNNGYSQGYSVFLNDMHGKLKSVSTYAYQLNPTNNPAYDAQFETRAEYVYQTQQNNPKKLNNRVTVLSADGQYAEAAIGEHADFFMDMIQHSNFSIGAGLQMNVEQMGPSVLPCPWPMIDYSEDMFRSVVAMKVIQQNGVLSEVKNTRNGATAYARNLMFDQETGQPLLTSLTNEHENPVYNYAYQGRWDYTKLEGAYKNYNYRINRNVTINPSNEYIFPYNNGAEDFSKGDMVEVESSCYPGKPFMNFWVSDVNVANNWIKLIDENGVPIASGCLVNTLRVVRSINANQLGVSQGSIVSLSNPVTDREFPLLEAFNQLLISNVQNINTVSYTDCATGQPKTANVSIGSNTITFSLVDGCTATLTLPNTVNSTYLPLNSNAIYLYRFYKRGNKILAAINTLGPTLNYMATWSDPTHCFSECLDDVLHADAVRFFDTWSFDYADLGNPTVIAHGASVQTKPLALAVTQNPYRFGKTGIWRGESSYAYQVDRKQGILEDNVANVTNTKKDGVYENFVLHNWQVTPAQNPYWTFLNAITKYNPYGFELENRDALGHHSAALYGYNNSVSTAVISNATYFEMGYDGFEDYTNGTYTTPGHGHLNLTAISNALSSADAHTGKYSVNLTAGNPTANYVAIPVVQKAAFPLDFNPMNTQTQFSLVADKRYSVCAWFKKNANAPANALPQITVTGASIVGTQIQAQKIEGWQRMEVTFDAPANGSVAIAFNFSNAGTGLLDDIRIQPFTSGMVTYVYDPLTLWLVAELDNRNFATFYNYDEEGSLTQVKKETEKGIVTVQTSRNNIAH
ncbi:MAG: hypothetical protein ACRCYO_00310, partial [Bacteroidia bacterium]